MSKDDIPLYRRVTLTPDGEGRYQASYVWKTYRFMFIDGSYVDIRAYRDDSDLRSAVLDVTGAKQIAGSAVLPEPEKVLAESQEPRKTAKRVAKRQEPA
jgi:hypothetical protein